jgi:hypothetical protein
MQEFIQDNGGSQGAAPTISLSCPVPEWSQPDHRNAQTSKSPLLLTLMLNTTQKLKINRSKGKQAALRPNRVQVGIMFRVIGPYELPDWRISCPDRTVRYLVLSRQFVHSRLCSVVKWACNAQLLSCPRLTSCWFSGVPTN